MNCYTCNETQAPPLVSCPSTERCGTGFDPKSLTWKRSEPTAFYADKIFSSHEATGSSLFYALDTSAAPTNFVTAYELTPCNGSCCCNTGLSSDAVFEISKSYVQVDCFSVNETAAAGATSAVITPANVTVNGTAVAGVTQANGVYTADITNVPLNAVCAAQSLPTKAYVLLQDIGNLRLRFRLGFEGVVRSCGTLYRFKAYVANNDTILLPETQTASFAVAQANIPCTENGNAPVLSFRFGARAQIVNPVLTVTVTDETDPCNGVTVNLAATMGITPILYAQVVRSTLMLVNGAEVCDDCPCGLDGFCMFDAGACCSSSYTPPISSQALIRGCGCKKTGV